jgi:hypothetical protein
MSKAMSESLACQPSRAAAITFWVQDWVQLEKQEWLRLLRKRHQIGHLDF